MSKEISATEARRLAVEQARRVLRGLFPAQEEAVFESRVIDDPELWLFFRNRDIKVPDGPDGTVSDDCAFAVSKCGIGLTVTDNFDDPAALEEQVRGLSGDFARLHERARNRP